MAANFGGWHQQLLGVDSANVALSLVNLLGSSRRTECFIAACDDIISFASYCQIMCLGNASLQESCNEYLGAA